MSDSGWISVTQLPLHNEEVVGKKMLIRLWEIISIEKIKGGTAINLRGEGHSIFTTENYHTLSALLTLSDK